MEGGKRGEGGEEKERESVQRGARVEEKERESVQQGEEMKGNKRVASEGKGKERESAPQN